MRIYCSCAYWRLWHIVEIFDITLQIHFLRNVQPSRCFFFNIYILYIFAIIPMHLQNFALGVQAYYKPAASWPVFGLHSAFTAHRNKLSPNTDIIVHGELRRFGTIMSQPVRFLFFFLNSLPAARCWYTDTRILSRGISPPRREENCACTSAMELLWCGLLIGASCSSCRRRTACTPLIIRRQRERVCVRARYVCAHIYMRAIWGVWSWWGMKMAQWVSLHVCAFHGVGGG